MCKMYLWWIERHILTVKWRENFKATKTIPKYTHMTAILKTCQNRLYIGHAQIKVKAIFTEGVPEQWPLTLLPLAANIGEGDWIEK